MLHPQKLGLAAGILTGLSMLILTIISVKTGYAADSLKLMEGVYPGYTVSMGGSIIGLIYGFVDGFVCLFLFGWLYNKLNG